MKECRIKHLPASFFSMILGLAGFTIASQKIEHMFHLPHFAIFVLWFSVVLFSALVIAYGVKILKYRNEVVREFNHPVKLSFFPAFSISMLLLSIAFLSVNMQVSKYLWVVGAFLHLVFTIKIISIWIHHPKFEIKHMNPAWFIPAVGNVLVPIAGVVHAPAQISWFFYSIGIFFWIILLVILFNRIIFHTPLPEKFLPTLFILIAPPAVAFISFVKMTGELNAFAQILYFFGLFLTILLVSQLGVFKKIKFYLSWWAYSFPIAAITIATILMYHETKLLGFKYLSGGLFAILAMLIIVLVSYTTIAVYRHEICVEEDE